MRRSSASVIAFILTTALAWAQTNPPGNPPPKAPEAKRITGVVTPDRVNENLENSAKRREAAGGPIPRGGTFFIWYADNPDEFSALARYSVVFLAVLTQKPEEMPVKRVYIRTSEGDLGLAKLSSWSSRNSDTLLSTRIYGPNREDGFYLFPTAAIFRDGQLQVEVSGSNAIMRIVQLPIKDPPERVSKFPREDARPGVRPDLRALQKFIAKKTSGFPMPRGVP